ncbi:MAG: preprotein translocase subunit SecG [Myxococcota bacterium]
METAIYALHFIVCFVLIGVVLLQRGKGADLGASLGGGGANTIFGGRGAGNFLTKITTASAIIFMGTSLTLSYLGYKSSDVQLFDGDAPFEVPVDGVTTTPVETEDGGLQEIEIDTSAAAEALDEAGLVEIPTDSEE